MKKSTIMMSAIAVALILSVGCVTAFAAGSGTPSSAAGQEAGASAAPEVDEEGAYSYVAGRQRSTGRNDLYAQAGQLPEEERDAFLAENGIGETSWSEEAAASYSYVGGQQRGASYRQDDDADGTQDRSGYSYVTGQQRGASYHK